MGWVKEQIGDIEIAFEGIQQAQITPSVMSKAAMTLVQHSIPLGYDLSAGVIGGVREGALKIGSQIFKFKYQIRTMRAITALEVYSEAIQWIEFQKSYNRVDPILADETMKYLREDCLRQLNKWI